MRFVLFAVLTVAVALPLSAQRPGDTLRAFTSDAEFVAFYRGLREEQERARRAADSAYRRRAEAEEQCRRQAVSLTITQQPDTASKHAVITGRAMPGALITISALNLKSNAGKDGRFRLVIPAEFLAAPRQFTLWAQLIGYDRASRTLTVERGDSVDMTLRLCQSVLRLESVVSLSAATVVVDGVQAEQASRSRSDEITNVQHAGVDEGGIVKVLGDHLVILRRGRLFTVAIGGSNLRSSAVLDAFGPEIDPRHTWYDELLVSGDKVVVVGYSYERGGTEVGVFNMDDAGALQYVATYQLRSNDYYSSRNYASRLIGTKLIFYAPLYLWAYPDNILAALPAARRWYRGVADTAFKRIAPPPRIYRAPQALSGDDIALHTVTVCDLTRSDLGCEASVIVGPSGRTFYVSPKAVYVWASSWARNRDQGAMLYRMPLDGSAPSAVGVTGSPVDQFSFLERDGQLNVLVRSEAYGDGMWLPEIAGGQAALLRIPVTAFGDGGARVPWWRYRQLPVPNDSARDAFNNRFVGSYLLYGIGSGWGRPQGDSSTLFVTQWTGTDDDRVTRLRVPHGVDRIEAMGSDAVIVGSDKTDLQFTAIHLAGTPAIAQRYTLPGASQGELRSHGFFYRMDDTDSGVLGLPVSGAGRAGWKHLIQGSAGVLFLRNSNQRFSPLGVLNATAKQANDRCRASCVDWYGNARPIFLHGRVFALLGYELVEGTIRGDQIAESRRISFAPGEQTVAR